MKGLLLIGLIHVFLTGGCLKSAATGSTSNQIPNTVVAEPTPTEKINDYNAFVIYSVVLSSLRHNYSFGKGVVDDLEAGDLLVYRNETIAPQGLEQAKDERGISSALIANFVDANNRRNDLEKDYHILDPTISELGPSDARIFFSNEKALHPKTKAVAMLSNIGMDLEKRLALVYVEYFSEIRGSQRFYLLLELERFIPEKETFKISGVKVVNVVYVQ
jgi:hypothetical protein